MLPSPKPDSGPPDEFQNNTISPLEVDLQPEMPNEKKSPIRIPTEIEPHYILDVVIHQATISIDVNVLHRVFSPLVKVKKITLAYTWINMEVGIRVDAQMEFYSIDDAILVKTILDGKNIYDYCCTLQINFASKKLTTISVVNNNWMSYDYTRNTESESNGSANMNVKPTVSGSVSPASESGCRCDDGNSSISTLMDFETSWNQETNDDDNINGNNNNNQDVLSPWDPNFCDLDFHPVPPHHTSTPERSPTETEAVQIKPEPNFRKFDTRTEVKPKSEWINKFSGENRLQGCEEVEPEPKKPNQFLESEIHPKNSYSNWLPEFKNKPKINKSNLFDESKNKPTKKRSKRFPGTKTESRIKVPKRISKGVVQRFWSEPNKFSDAGSESNLSSNCPFSPSNERPAEFLPHEGNMSQIPWNHQSHQNPRGTRFEKFSIGGPACENQTDAQQNFFNPLPRKAGTGGLRPYDSRLDGPPGKVCMIKGLPGFMDPYKVFNLICIYGDVIRVKFLVLHQGMALVEMADPASACRVISHLNGLSFYGFTLRITLSNQQQVFVNKFKAFHLASGAVQFVDFTNSPLNRYSSPAMAAKNRIVIPTCALNFFNLANHIDTEMKLRKIFSEFAQLMNGLPMPNRVVLSPGCLRDGTRFGHMYFSSLSESTETLIKLNNIEIYDPENPQTSTTFKLCYSNWDIK